MSTWAIHPVVCPCGAEFSAQLADGLHITRLPEVRARILDGTFHTATCPSCRVTGVVQTKTLYTDFERHHWVAVAPRWLVGDFAAWEDVVTREFDHNMRVAAPPMVRALAGAFVVRLVFGLDGLAEKLRAWDAGLDDRVVEVLKWQIISRRPDLVAPGVRIRLAAVDRNAWRLDLSLERPGVSGLSFVELNLDAYCQAERDAPSAPWDLLGPEGAPLVSLDRAFAGSLAAAWPESRGLRVARPMRPHDQVALFPEPGS